MNTALFRIRLDVPAEAVDLALAAALATGAQGVEVKDAETGGPPPGRVYVIVWHAAETDDPRHREEMMAALRHRVGDGAEISWAAEGDAWQTRLAEDLPPTPLGTQFVALSPGSPVPMDRLPLWLVSGGGFGSGMHPTTALCVDLLESRVDADTEVLDVGCGSGVLALVALLLGARKAIGVDIDSVALVAAARNAEHNGVGQKAHWQAEMPTEGAQLVLANLYPGPLTQLAPQLSARVQPGGTLIISGFREGQRDALASLYADHGLHVVDAESRAGWHGLVLSSPAEVATP